MFNKSNFQTYFLTLYKLCRITTILKAIPVMQVVEIFKPVSFVQLPLNELEPILIPTLINLALTTLAIYVVIHLYVAHVLM